MRKIKIKNFGPIKEGLVEGDGFLEVKKVTVFTGNQATGKSTVAKMVSTMAWIEKEWLRGGILIGDPDNNRRFVEDFCAYQGLKNYFLKDSEIHFVGDYAEIRYTDGNFNLRKIIVDEELYLVPKIMYVPAERNFLSVVEFPQRLEGLPWPLYTFLDEYRRSLNELTSFLELPINNLHLEVEGMTKLPFIRGYDYRLRLSESSSGLHSAVPLYLVSKNLAESIGKVGDRSRSPLSLEIEERMEKEFLTWVVDQKASAIPHSEMFKIIQSKYKSSYFFNIVEELEQNLFPKSQMSLLFSLLGLANVHPSNTLLLTTHSPYIVNYLTLAIKADEVAHLIKGIADAEERLQELDLIVPRSSAINADDAVIYEFDEEGRIRKLEAFHGIPSDRNQLNEYLGEANDLFDKLLAIEQLL